MFDVLLVFPNLCFWLPCGNHPVQNQLASFSEFSYALGFINVFFLDFPLPFEFPLIDDGFVAVVYLCFELPDFPQEHLDYLKVVFVRFLD